MRQYRFAMISRHEITEEQMQLAAEQGIELRPWGDLDAFSSGLRAALKQIWRCGYEGVIAVHPLIALQAHKLGLLVGCFENADRAPIGEKPQFKAVRLQVVNPQE